jgi:OmpA-OmpF porin, OOP family
MKKLIIFLSLGAMILTTPLFAQRTSDIENSMDYPHLSRFDSSIIGYYKETKWGSYLLPISEKGKIDWGNPMALEGRVVRIQYTVSKDNNSEFVLHNYKTAFKDADFDVLIAIANEQLGVSDRPHTWHGKYYVAGGYYNGLNNEKFGLGIGFPIWNNNHCFIAAKGHKDGKDIYAVIYAIVDEKYTLITQDIIEVESVETGLVSASRITKDLSSAGHIAIYDISFDGDKASIKPESTEALSNIAEFLKSSSDKKYYIVGHAAGVGDFDKGMKLSELRAKAVVDELINKYGVMSTQLKSYGVGALSPVASNQSKEGMEKNRRVEIVEQ